MRSVVEVLRSVLHDAAGAFTLLSTSTDLHITHAEHMPPERLREVLTKSTGRLHAALDQAGEALRKENEMQDRGVEVKVTLKIVNRYEEVRVPSRAVIDVLLRVIDNGDDEGLKQRARGEVMKELKRTQTVYGTLGDETYAFIMLSPGDTVLFLDIQRVVPDKQEEAG